MLLRMSHCPSQIGSLGLGNGAWAISNEDPLKLNPCWSWFSPDCDIVVNITAVPSVSFHIRPVRQVVQLIDVTLNLWRESVYHLWGFLHNLNGLFAPFFISCFFLKKGKKDKNITGQTVECFSQCKYLNSCNKVNLGSDKINRICR